MERRYFTAKELIEGGICTPGELVEKCDSGELQALTPEGKRVLPVSFDELKWQEKKARDYVRGTASYLEETVYFPFDPMTATLAGISTQEHASTLAKLKFKLTGIEAAFPSAAAKSEATGEHAEQQESAPDAPQPQAANADERQPVNVPPSLWQGKTPKAAYDALKRKEYADCVIAATLMKLDGGKTSLGRLFYQDEIRKGVEREAGSYRRKVDTLVEKCNKLYLLTFNEETH